MTLNLKMRHTHAQKRSVLNYCADSGKFNLKIKIKKQKRTLNYISFLL